MKVWQLGVAVEVVSLAIAGALALIPEPGTAPTVAYLLTDDPSTPLRFGVDFLTISLLLTFLVVGFFVLLRIRSRTTSQD